MAIQIADNFKYQGKKPLDFRTQCKDIASLVAMKTSTIYDGIIVYVTDEQKFYVYDSKNTEDPVMKKWKEFQGGSSDSTIKEYAQDMAITKDTLVVKDGKLYIAKQDFTSDNTQSDVDGSLNLDITNGNLEPISMDDTHSYEYTIGESYVKDNLLVHNNKLYIVTADFTAADFTVEETAGTIVAVDSDTDTHSFTYKVGESYVSGNLIVKDHKMYLVENDFVAADFDTELNAGDLIPVDTDIDTHSYEYEVGRSYKKNYLLIKDNKLYLIANDFTAVNFDAEVTNKDIIPVDTDTDSHTVVYQQDTDYTQGNLVVFDEKLYIAITSFKSDNTETDPADSLQKDIDANNLKHVCIDTNDNCSEYEQDKFYKKDTLVYNGNKIGRVVADYNSDNTKTTVDESFDADVTAGNIVVIVSASDSELTEDVTSRVTVGNINLGDQLNTGMTFTEFVKKLLLKEILPTGKITAPSAGLNLKGTTVASPTITATITSLGSCTIDKVEFYRGSTLEDTQTYVTGTNTYTHQTADINSDQSVSIKIYYTQSDKTTTGVLSYSANYKFMNNSYFGVLANVPTEADVITLATTLKDVKAFTGVCSPSYEHIVYAYPASLGNLANIKDENNFEYNDSYTRLVLTVNGESYNVYYLTDPVTATQFKQMYS